MKSFLSLILAVALLALPACTPTLAQSSAPDVAFRVAAQPTERNVPRLGLNLGSRTSWGAEQLMANVLLNPGFEATGDGAIVIVRQATGAEFTDDSSWLKRADHFWDGATFSIRTGRLAGTSGRITTSDTWQGYSHFVAQRELKGLAPGDVIALHRERSAGLPANWWWEGNSRNRIRTSEQHPPHSGGAQSIMLAPDNDQSVSAISYVDMIGDRAGKLLSMRGPWEVRFWAKGNGHAHLTVQCRRLNAPAFLRQSVTPTAEWREYHFRFTPHDDAAPAGVEFRLEAQGAGGEVWVDDASLAPVDAAPSGFRREVVENLRTMHPGYLRDWQGQLGDSLANRMAEPGTRHPFRYRPGDESAYGYSLPEFFALCHEVDAEPWVVLPTTLNDDEWRQAGVVLRQAIERYGFREVVVEYGNENWNTIFRAAGIQDATHMALAAQRGFSLLQSAAGNLAGNLADNGTHILPAIGGQFVNADAMRDASKLAPQARLIAIAPYYATSINAKAATAATLFAVDTRAIEAQQRVAAKSGKQLAIYEMNAHSLGGDAPSSVVSPLISGYASGTALLFHSLGALDAGMVRQCMYTLAGFDTFRADGKLARLFGLARDLATPNRLRPTGLALALANHGFGGDYYRTTPVHPGSTQEVRVAAFLDHGEWSVIAASASPRAQWITVELPTGAGKPPNRQMHLVAPPEAASSDVAPPEAASPNTAHPELATNEDSPQVRLREEPLVPQGRSIRLHLAPYGLAAAYSEPAGVSIRNTAPGHGTAAEAAAQR